MNRDALGSRMKEYENVTRDYLMRRNPIIIRLDGRAFHSFTKGLRRPFDSVLMETMQETAKVLCNEIQGSRIAYVQSDEISILVTDYDKLTSCAWFDGNIQKIVSVSASVATLAFNKKFREFFNTISLFALEDEAEYVETLKGKLDRAMFDSRVFSIPKDEVCNYFIWRQQDATRNAIQMVGQANFSHKELQRKNCNQIQEMLFQERNINFNNLPVSMKRGTCIIKVQYLKEETLRSKWVTDLEIPIFTQDREYVEKYV